MVLKIKIKIIILLSGLFFVLSAIAYTQDVLITIDQDTIACKILDITDGNIEFEYRQGDKTINTFLPLEKTQDYQFGITNKFSQDLDTTSVYNIELLDGSVIYGSISNIDKEQILVSTKSLGLVWIHVVEIEKMELTEYISNKADKYWFPNPNPTRYLFAPSAYNLKKGSGYFQNAYVIVNSVNYGITNTISIGGGFEFMSTFISLSGGETKPILFLTPKMGFKISPKIHIGNGLMMATFPNEKEINENKYTTVMKGAGIIYGVGTYGGIEHNITLGCGWGYFIDQFESKPLITINGMTRVKKRISLITENWIVPVEGYYAIITYGARFFGEKISVDMAFINSEDIIKEIFIGVPYLDFVVTF